MYRLFILLVSLSLASPANLLGQHKVSVQNNTSLDYNFQVVQAGNITLTANQYTIMSTQLTAYASGMDMLEFEPDTIMVPGDTVDFIGTLTNGGDTVILQMRLVAGNSETEVFYSGIGNSFDLPWFSDNSFHGDTFSMQGSPLTFKFKRVLDTVDLDDDVLFAVQEDFLYSIDPADQSDPNVINVMNYNIQMTPIVSFNFFERATYFPPLISPNQDVVVVEEIFEDMTRVNDLTPAMEAVGFLYYTTVLNDTALSSVTSQTNGGVLIYSKWPIETEAEMKYANCSNNNSFDCLASKGVKYARVNKLGKIYHIFGTHMEAGGSAADVQIRMEQYGEIANFMDTMAIPTDEPVIFAGDFNTGPLDGVEYDALRDSTNPIIPQHNGYFESTFSYADTGKIIDHVWGQADHLQPWESYNKVITFRSVDSVMWDIFDFSDHRTVLGRFVYPSIQPDPFVDTTLCANDSLTLSVGSIDPLNYQWTLDGVDIPGANASTYAISSPGAGSVGTYVCEVTNSTVYGDQGDVLSQIFFPNGPDTLVQTFSYTIASVGFQDSCGVGINEMEERANLFVVPMPNDGRFEILLQEINGYEILELYNNFGERISRRKVNSMSEFYDMPDLAAGIYVLRASGKANSTTVKILIY